MDFFALDLETESLDLAHPEYALQPWRVQEEKAEISLVCTAHHIYSYIVSVKNLENLCQKYVWTWNGVFDIAFLIASGVDCSKVKWLDAMSAYKWVIRSQMTDMPAEGIRHSWSLKNASTVILKGWKHYQEFLSIKEEMLTDREYWVRRCQLDTEATLLIGKKLWEKMTSKQRKSFLIEQEMMHPTALAWVNGCRYDLEAAQKLDVDIGLEKGAIINDLAPIINPDNSEGRPGVEFITQTLASPKKVASVIWDLWGVPFKEEYRTSKGARSVGKDILQWLIEDHSKQFPQLKLVKQYRDLKSKYDKFIAGPQKIQKYIGSNIFHHNWRINSTYTGRCTVTSKCSKKFPVGLPMHQIPKQGDYRKFILPPEGECFIIADVDSQETKLMTDFSRDPAFLEVYAEGLNPHAYTASKISGVPYKEIVEGKEQDDYLATVYKAGKITNLGGNYRMGAKTLWKNAHTQWELTPTLAEAQNWTKIWRQTYQGVTQQWDRFTRRAATSGYAETLAGRRFYIHKWHTHKWASESSAIMIPIQGTGADMKYLAIAAMRKKFPELTFWGEIHDEIIYTMPVKGFTLTASVEGVCKNVKNLLDNLPYEKAWGWSPKVPFTWSVTWGNNWKEQHGD